MQMTTNTVEYDQLADPSPINNPDGGAFLYYDADNNVAGKAAIGMAISKPKRKTLNVELLKSELDVKINEF